MLKKWLKTRIRNLLTRIMAEERQVSSSNRLPASWQVYRDYIQVHDSAIIDPSSTLRIFNLPESRRIMVEVGANSHVFGHLSITRPEGSIKIGERCQIGNSQFNCAIRIELGNDILMAWGVTVMDNDSHSLDWALRSQDVAQCYKDSQDHPGNFIKNKNWSNVPMAPIRIHDRAWIGFNVSILKGVEVGAGAILGAASVVTKRVNPLAVVVGNPAKVVKSLSDIAHSVRDMGPVPGTNR